MASTIRGKTFIDSAEGQWLRSELIAMVESPKYNTRMPHQIISEDPADVAAVFVEKHLAYMSKYPTLNHRQYVSNLKLKTFISA